MDKKIKKHVSELWQRYFPNAGQPIAVFYADTLHGAGCEVMLTFAFAEKTFLDTYIWQPLKNR